MNEQFAHSLNDPNGEYRWHIANASLNAIRKNEIGVLEEEMNQLKKRLAHAKKLVAKAMMD